jgi:hypothetical protein
MPAKMSHPQELPIEFNPALLYTIGNITGNITGYVTTYHTIKPFIYLDLFKGGARNYNKSLMMEVAPNSPIFILSKEEERCLRKSLYQPLLRLR